MRLFDAHNHLQDDRLNAHRERIAVALPHLGLVRAVVAGSGEEDWQSVADLSHLHPWVLPSFGVHPWYVKEQSPHWKDRLEALLSAFPEAGIGEIGLDRWIENPDVALQVRFFREQLAIAARDNRAATVHCLRAWGLLEETLRSSPRPERGFLLHSYGGPVEMVPGFVKLGAYFSISPYFFHERKARQLETFRHVPLDRLLLETDAPDMWPPEALNPHPLRDAEDKPINDPSNILLVYQEAAKLRGMEFEDLAAQVEQNFTCLFCR
ncbi:MAG: hydrolase TatD [Verrucomicrobiaceae bacterium]|nr:hydrolase TatD [Verrucomicrobiaceae bacterium]